ncbi:hypothetical protein WME75_46370 [Sorangium sp. So ce1014]|uniref:hypothetical protein n=1 Tax=Sorangium sp. So ce1014 TaxID=3133326 RepID=UPI003F64832F
MIVYPHEGVDRIRFGMPRADVERTLSIAPKRFKRNAYGLEEDYFESLGLFVSYDERGSCDAVSVARGCGTDLDYDGYRLFAHPARDVRMWALLRDPQLDPKDGFNSKALGLGMWADWIDEPELEPDELLDPAASFIVFCPGYYEQAWTRMADSGLVAPGSCNGPIPADR